jgi:predicted ATPase
LIYCNEYAILVRHMSNKIKGSTKIKLISLGLSAESATLLATGRNWKDLESLSSIDFFKLVVNFSNNDKIIVEEKIRPDLKVIDRTMHIKSREPKMVGITLSNFKGFKESFDKPTFIPLRPLTLVYGPNNGGKSSILKGLASIPQTLLKRKSMEGNEQWSPDGPWFNLGSFPQVLNNPEEGTFSIGFVSLLPSKGDQKEYRELRYTYEIAKQGDDKNTGKIVRVQVFGGEFEDYLELLLDLQPAELSEEEMREYRWRDATADVLKIVEMSENIERSLKEGIQLGRLMLEQQNQFASVLEVLDENNEIKLGHKCPECMMFFRSSKKRKKLKAHLKTEHGLTMEAKENTGTFGQQNTKLSHIMREWLDRYHTFLDIRDEALESEKNRRGNHNSHVERRLQSLIQGMFATWLECLQSIWSASEKVCVKWPKALREYTITDEMDISSLIEKLASDYERELQRMKEWELSERGNQAQQDLQHRSFRAKFRAQRHLDKYVSLMVNSITNIEEDSKNIFVSISHGLSLTSLSRIRRTTNALSRELEICERLSTSLIQRFQGVDYLSATRLVPQRNYSARTGGSSTQGVTGERTLALLANDNNLQSWVNEMLGDLIGLNITVKNRKSSWTIGGQKKTYQTDDLDVRIKRVGSEEDRLQLPDVGFGVSQLLPILAAIKSSNSLIIEEPESNLHPGAQQKLMKIMASQISRESSVIMETHSEHFLLEVLNAISDSENPLRDEDVSILYVHNTPEEGTKVKRHTTSDGNLDERFPRQFTGDYQLSII